MKTSNIKDTMTTLAAWLSGLGIFLGGLNITVLHLPIWVTAVGGALIGFAAMINGIYGGKNPNGSTKTPTQVNELNQAAADTQPIKPV
jgi:hypothetical protein